MTSISLARGKLKEARRRLADAIDELPNTPIYHGKKRRLVGAVGSIDKALSLLANLQ